MGYTARAYRARPGKEADVKTTPSLLAAPLLTLGLLAPACDSPPAADKGKKTDAAKNADNKTNAAKNAGKKADATKTAGNRADATKTAGNRANATEAAGTKPPSKAAGAKPDAAAGGSDRAAAATGRKYRRGQLPPGGMSIEELEKFATDVGDPTGGKFTLDQAFAGDPDLADKSKGTLTASFDTTMGQFDCELYEDKVPLTVANFVGLARGKRATYDKKTDSWVEKNYYDGVIFHRVIKNFMVQTGDATGSGRGNPGYVIPDEFDKSLRHSGPGILSMANRSEPNTGNTQFFIIVNKTKHLDGKHAVFGQCPEASVPIEISKVKVDHRAGDRPYETVKINAVTISRKGKAGKKAKGK
ncbi:MAG: peptidylprolyl isomerase [Myxococcota bacterium]